MTSTDSTASVTVRPIHFTSKLDAVAARLLALGLCRVDGSAGDGWQVFQAPAGGRVGIHQANPGSAEDGTTRLGFEVAERSTLDALATRFADRPGGAVAELVEQGHGTALRIVAADGLPLLIDVCAAASSAETIRPGVEVDQMWFTPDPPGAREVLLRLGVTELVTTEGLGWDDSRAPGGGRTQLHAGGSASVSLGFMSATPLEELKAKVDAAGDEGSIVDEAWGRYLALAPVTVAIPDTPLDGELTWVNEEQRDYHGYQVLRDPTDR